MTDFLIGIDAGGTKTRALAYRTDDYSPVPASEARTGPGNVTSDPKGASESILAAAEQCAEKARSLLGGTCRYVSLGAAGFSSVAGQAMQENGFDQRLSSLSGGFSTKVSDAALSLHANFASGEPGMTVIAGTGSSAFLQLSDNSILRAGGWGSVLGDAGSGWSAAREGVRRLLALLDSGNKKDADDFFSRWRAAHESGPASEHPFPEACTVPALIAFVMNRPKKDLSRLACGLVSLYDGGDPLCRDILAGETDALSSDCERLIRAAGGRLSGTLPVVLTGGFFESNPSVRALFRKAMESCVSLPLVWREEPADPTRAVIRHYLEAKRGDRDPEAVVPQ